MAKNNQSIQAIRGMHDLLPENSPSWQYAEKIIRDVLASYCYKEILLLKKQSFLSDLLGK